MAIELIQPEYCEEFNWNSCAECMYALELEEDVLQCPKLKDIEDCDGCPFRTGGDYETLCSPSPDGFHPCENDEYIQMLIPNLIRHLNKAQMAYERHVTQHEKEEERKQVVKEERRLRSSKTRSATYDISYKIKMARKKLRALKEAESRERSLFMTFSIVGSMMDGTENKEFISRYATKIEELIKQINSLLDERKIVSKRAKAEIKSKEDSILAKDVNKCIEDIISNGIKKPCDILVITIDSNPVGLSCEVDSIMYIALAKFANVKPSAKAVREKYTRVDFTFDDCNSELLAQFNKRIDDFYTSQLVIFKDEYISRTEKRLGIKNMEITDAKVKDEILKSLLK